LKTLRKNNTHGSYMRKYGICSKTNWTFNHTIVFFFLIKFFLILRRSQKLAKRYWQKIKELYTDELIRSNYKYTNPVFTIFFTNISQLKKKTDFLFVKSVFFSVLSIWKNHNKYWWEELVKTGLVVWSKRLTLFIVVIVVVSKFLNFTLKNLINFLTHQENSNPLMLSLSIFVALILIDVCAALQEKSGGGRSTFIGLKYITYWIQNYWDLETCRKS